MNNVWFHPEMFSIRKYFFSFNRLLLVFMLTNLYNANIKVSCWLIKENKMCVFSKEGMKNGTAFYEGKRK